MQKLIITIIVCSLLLIMSGLGIYFYSNDDNKQKQEPAKIAEKLVVDGNITNVEETLRKQHIYKDYRIKTLQISKEGDYYTIQFSIDNLSSESIEHGIYNFAFLDSNGKLIDEIEIEIPYLEANETKKVVSLDGTLAIYDAFDYKVSPAKQVKLPKKN